MTSQSPAWRARRLQIPIVTLAAALSLCSGTMRTLGAQVAGSSDSVARRIEPLEVRGARGTTIVGGAAAVVVRPDSQRSGPASTLADLLRTVPQVLVRTNSRGETELSVRGSESRQVSLMLNGLPLSPSWDGRADPSLVPLSGVTELTYVRSTGSLLGGPNAIGGVVDLQIGAPAAGGERALSIGSDQTGARLLAASAGESRAFASGALSYWRLGGGYRARDGQVRAHGVSDPDPGAALRTNTDLRQTDGFAAVGVQSARGGHLSLLVTGYDTERGVAPELHLTAPRYWRYPTQARTAVQLRAVSRPLSSAAGVSALEVSAGLLGTQVRIRSFADDAYTTVIATEAGTERVQSGRLALAHAMPGGTIVKAALTANEVRYDETLDAAPASRYRQGLVSAGVESQWVIGGRSLLSAGVVLDAAHTLESGGKPEAPSRTRPGWRVGATSRVAADLRVHASVSQRVRFAALRELYSGALNRFEPNPDLRPERLIAAETGVTWGAAESALGMNVQAVAFHHWLDDAIIRVRYDTTNRFIRVNRDETRSTGVELTVGMLDHAGRSLRLDAVAQSVRVRNALAGGAGQKPEHMPNLRATLDGLIAVGGGVALGATLTHIGSQYCVNAETDEDVALTSQTVPSVTAQRTWTLAGRGFRSMRVLFGADNLLDAAIYEQCGLPRAGRTLRVGIEFR